MMIVLVRQVHTNSVGTVYVVSSSVVCNRQIFITADRKIHEFDNCVRYIVTWVVDLHVRSHCNFVPHEGGHDMVTGIFTVFDGIMCHCHLGRIHCKESDTVVQSWF